MLGLRTVQCLEHLLGMGIAKWLINYCGRSFADDEVLSSINYSPARTTSVVCYVGHNCALGRTC